MFSRIVRNSLKKRLDFIYFSHMPPQPLQPLHPPHDGLPFLCRLRIDQTARAAARSKSSPTPIEERFPSKNCTIVSSPFCLLFFFPSTILSSHQTGNLSMVFFETFYLIIVLEYGTIRARPNGPAYFYDRKSVVSQRSGGRRSIEDTGICRELFGNHSHAVKEKRQCTLHRHCQRT